MAKRQKMSALQLEDLPEEMILTVFTYLDIRDLMSCGQVSKRIRQIRNIESLWQNVDPQDIYQVKTDFMAILKHPGSSWFGKEDPGYLRRCLQVIFRTFFFLKGKCTKRPMSTFGCTFSAFFGFWVFFLWSPLGSYEKKSCLKKLKLCEVSENPKSSICWEFH